MAATGDELTITDPDFSVRLPVGWFEITGEDYLRQYRAVVDAAGDPRLTQSFEWQRDRIEAGIVRKIGAGQAPGGASTVIGIEVVPLVSDLPTTVDAVLMDYAGNGLPIQPESGGLADLPVSPSACASYVVDIEIGSPSRTTTYFALLPSGEVVSVFGTAPTDDLEFPAVVGSVARSIAPG